VEEARLLGAEVGVLVRRRGVAGRGVAGRGAAAEVGELHRCAGAEVEGEEVVTLAVDDPRAVRAEAGIGLTGRRAREAREAVGLEVVEEEVAVASDDAATEAGVVGEAVGPPTFEARGQAPPFLGRKQDGLTTVRPRLEERVRLEPALRVPPEVDPLAPVGPEHVGGPGPDPRLGIRRDEVHGEGRALLGERRERREQREDEEKATGHRSRATGNRPQVTGGPRTVGGGAFPMPPFPSIPQSPGASGMTRPAWGRTSPPVRRRSGTSFRCGSGLTRPPVSGVTRAVTKGATTEKRNSCWNS